MEGGCTADMAQGIMVRAGKKVCTKVMGTTNINIIIVIPPKVSKRRV